jgi:hypothetical protein
MTRSLSEATRRSRAPLWADLRILVLGIWGFVRQCLKSCGRTAKQPHELESGK